MVDVPPYFQPPVVVTPNGSLGESDIGETSEEMLEPIQLNSDMSPIECHPSLCFDPIPFKVPCRPISHVEVAASTSIEPYPVQASQSDHVQAPHSWNMLTGNSTVQPNWEFSAGSNEVVSAPNGSGADQVLDEAVDAIFSSGAMLEDIANLDDLWDNTTFGGEKVEDDTQLGYLLERFLEDGC
jgi:hypothetical protein